MSGELKATFAALPSTTRGQPLIISGKLDKKNMLYTNGNSVYIRNFEDPSVCDVYTEHTQKTSVARYSPSGFYIASADITGKVRIWDTVNIEHILKNEFQPFSGIIKDLDWSGDSQRIVVGGQGREKFVHPFSADTGTSIGEMLGHSKQVNAVAFKSNRPFRIVSASEDQSLCFYQGPPFKLSMTIEDHKNFVNAVKYSPDGSKFVSGGSDGRSFVYDGKTGEKMLELGSPAHKGGIYGVDISGDSKEALTVSGDKTAKIWNLESGDVVCEFVLGKSVPDMQVGCAWLGDTIITVSLSGNINYLDRSNPSSPSQIIKGHSKQIKALLAAGDVLYSGDADGKICIWNANTGTCDEVSGTGHTAQIQSLALAGDTLISCSFDDSVRTIDLASGSYSDMVVKMSSQPQGVAAGADGLVVVACLNEIVVLQNGRLMYTETVKYEPSSVSIHPGQSEVAVGGSQDSRVHVYSLNAGTLSETRDITHTGAITSVAYSPDGAYLAASDSNRKVELYSCPNYEPLVGGKWTAHTAKVLSLAWSPNSQYVASGALDTDVIVWNANETTKKIKISRAHKMSAVSAVSWRSDNELISAGHDANIKLWNVSF